MASHGKRSVPTTARLLETARGIKQSHTIQLESHKDLRSRFSLHFHEPQTSPSPKGDRRAEWRTNKQRSTYATALAKGCHFFVVSRCVSSRTSSEKAVDELLRGVGQNTDGYQFTLNEETVTLFRNWATADNYTAAPDFANFINSISSGAEGYSSADLETVQRMLAARGLSDTRGSPSHENPVPKPYSSQPRSLSSMKTKHQTDRTSAEQQAAATYEQQQLAPGQHGMDLGMDEDGMMEEQHNMDLDTPGPEQHELMGGEHNMEFEREMVLEQSREQLPGDPEWSYSDTPVTYLEEDLNMITLHIKEALQEQQSMDSGEREEGARNTLYNCVVAR